MGALQDGHGAGDQARRHLLQKTVRCACADHLTPTNTAGHDAGNTGTDDGLVKVLGGGRNSLAGERETTILK